MLAYKLRQQLEWLFVHMSEDESSLLLCLGVPDEHWWLALALEPYSACSDSQCTACFALHHLKAFSINSTSANLANIIQTCFGVLQMENRFIFLGEVWFLAFEIRSDSIKVKIVTSIVERGGFAIDITPVCADLCFLIKRSAVRTQESEVLDLK